MSLSRMRADVVRLKHENEIFNKAMEYFAKDALRSRGGDQVASKQIGAAADVQVLGVNVYAYRALKRGVTQDHKCLADAQLLALICAIQSKVEVFYNRKRPH